MKKFYKYKHYLILNKTFIPNLIFNNIIDFCIPKKIRNKHITFTFVPIKNYKQEIHKLHLSSKIYSRVKELYPFVGVSIPLYYKKDKVTPKIITAVPKNNYIFKFYGSTKSGYLRAKLYNIYEVLIYVLTHEFGHVRRFYNKSSLKKSLEETLCDKAAMKKVKQWRRLNK